MPDMGINGNLGVLRIAAMRTIPRFICTNSRQYRQTLGAAARSPEWQVAALEDFLGSTPWVPLDFTKVFEIAGEKSAKGPWLRLAERFIKPAQPDLLSLEDFPPGTGFG